MSIFSVENGLVGTELELVSHSEECSVYQMSGSDGNGVMTCYQVFPGVELIYNDFHRSDCFQGSCPQPNIMEINHCREGRFECDFRDGSCAYLEEGDLSVNMLGNRAKNSCFPLEHYHGVSVVVQMEEASRSISNVLSDISIDLYALRDKLCDHNHCFIMRTTESIEHIFSELYRVPGHIKKGYFKLKVLELFLFLSAVEKSDQMDRRQYFHRSQVDIVKEVKAYMTENLERHDTLEELAERFCIPLTAMKLCFKGVYGMSVYSFIRNYRMQAAAVMLRQRKDSVADIACSVGYLNASKFASAFKAVMGMSPLEYRKVNFARPNGSKMICKE